MVDECHLRFRSLFPSKFVFGCVAVFSSVLCMGGTNRIV